MANVTYLIGAGASAGNEKWGFLREHSSKANGKDPLTGLHRTGLDEYCRLYFQIRMIGFMIKHLEFMKMELIIKSDRITEVTV